MAIIWCMPRIPQEVRNHDYPVCMSAQQSSHGHSLLVDHLQDPAICRSGVALKRYDEVGDCDARIHLVRKKQMRRALFNTASSG
jgi:hypothetical protein